ncbi:MAG: hypothetical protein N3A54_02635 [Patescibacteria group bacterium]|nr:hypothetical protein [Patescibacteria group bacterium]
MSIGHENVPLIKRPITWIIIGVVFAVVGIIGFGMYQYQKVQAELAKLKTSTMGPLTEDRQRELIEEVSSRIILPNDEKPTVAVVSDINRLKDQQFFSAGQNGDIVLIYMNAKKAILYRPSEKKVVEVAPVNLNNNQATVAGAITQGTVGNQSQRSLQEQQNITPSLTTGLSPTPAPMKFSLRNGTNFTGLARIFEQQLLAKFPTANVTERGNAAKRDYSSSVIIDLTGQRSSDLQFIASILGISPSSLPAGEQKPVGADFLIIIGADKL